MHWTSRCVLFLPDLDVAARAERRRDPLDDVPDLGGDFGLAPATGSAGSRLPPEGRRAQPRARARSRRRAGLACPPYRTSNCTAALSIPGRSRSSSRSAAHLASPTVSPLPSTDSSSAISVAPSSSSGGRPCGCAWPVVGFGFGGWRFAPFPSPSPPSFGAVRDVRFSGGFGFGARRRVTSPCPTVHRFVVIQ